MPTMLYYGRGGISHPAYLTIGQVMRHCGQRTVAHMNWDCMMVQPFRLCRRLILAAVSDRWKKGHSTRQQRICGNIYHPARTEPPQSSKAVPGGLGGIVVIQMLFKWLCREHLVI